MQTLTDDGRTLVEQIARRHNVGTDAVLTLLTALDRGGGTQAQFSHSELGGMGQWSRGGMIMVGDMFNNGLKARVDQLCEELSSALGGRALFMPEARSGAGSGGSWWPAACGTPSSSGSQNDMSYACFPDTRRLAIKRGGVISVYDMGDHRIGGVSQQQSGSQDLAFTSQYGTVRLHELARVGDTPASAPPLSVDSDTREMARPTSAAVGPSPTGSTDEDIFAKIERLHGLQAKGILSEAEFAEKKKELLARI